VAIIADAIQAKPVQRLQGLLKHQLDGSLVSLERLPTPALVEDVLQSCSCLERERMRLLVRLCERTKQILRTNN
jgi:hypothetical protein